jgi:hypothetical protein
LFELLVFPGGVPVEGPETVEKMEALFVTVVFFVLI